MDVYYSQRGIHTLDKLTLHYNLIKPIVASSQKTPCLVIFPCPPFKCAGFYSLWRDAMPTKCNRINKSAKQLGSCPKDFHYFYLGFKCLQSQKKYIYHTDNNRNLKKNNDGMDWGLIMFWVVFYFSNTLHISSPYQVSINTLQYFLGLFSLALHN